MRRFIGALYGIIGSGGGRDGGYHYPGHIYAAFALEAEPDEVRRVFNWSDELVFHEEKAWIPVEITMFQDSFEKAWQVGAKEWRENESRDQSRFYPTRDSWRTYQAVGFREGALDIQLPDKDEVTAAFISTLTRHVEREIYPQAARIQEKMERAQDKTRYQNMLAVLYARYGLYDQALQSFQAIVARRDYTPALINLGNIHFLKKDFEAAHTFYQRVLDGDSRNKSALLGVARCNHELENYGLVSKIYRQLEEVDPDLAQRFAYLDLRGSEGARAADAAGLREIALWEEEEE